MRLLVSVTTADEIIAALAGGADLLDLKNPAEGSLGAPPPALIRVARRLAPATVPVSAALGDFPPLPGSAALAAVGAAQTGAHYVKIGLLAPPPMAFAVARAVRTALDEFAPHARLILATYADTTSEEAVSVAALPRLAAEAGADGCLIDTLHKDGRTLHEHLAPAVLEAYVRQCHDHDLSAALAGALQADDLPALAALGTDLVGVRGAACQGGRTGHLDPLLVRALKNRLPD
ncbi:MAG: (5-formylfuran-3-yl)methyl phosphate synthase [Ardenticatenaceae bacterium]|nr:(5-formylfuran-3-yl)methyl phosphate synthase [Ardenticatenaceae bacterium]